MGPVASILVVGRRNSAQTKDCNWSRTKLLEFLDASIVDQICGIPIPSTNQLDAFIWGPCLNGEFTIKSDTWLQSSDLDPHDDQSPLLKKRRKLFPIFFAKAQLLAKFGLCNDIHNADNLVQRLNDIFVNVTFDATKFERILTLCWQMWLKRNNLIFKNEVFSPFVVVVVATAFQNRNHFHQEMASQSSLTSSSIRWTPPPQNIVKVNFDGSVLQHDSSVVVGFIFQDCSGCPLLASAWVGESQCSHCRSYCP
ncbi:hypothetical protein ACLB2K_004360 [Fragaria x ananassa]